MQHPTLSKKILIVSSWAPPRPGGSAQHLYNFFKRFDPKKYALFTREDNIHVKEPGLKLPSEYYFYRRGALRTIQEGLRIIRRGDFDLLYATSDSGRGLLLSLVLSLLSGRSLVLHFFDIYRGNSFPLAWSMIAWLLEPALLFRAQKTILPNEAIYEEYCKRYPFLQEKFLCINNGAFDEAHADLRTPIIPHAAPYHIVSTGSIYWAQEESVRCLAEAARGCNDLFVELYTPRRVQDNVQRIADASPNVIAKSAEPATMPAIQTAADILFVPLARASESPVVTQTALPGRLPEYLVAGRPLVVHAPSGSFMALYARREGFAHVVESYDPLVLRHELRRVLQDSVYQRKLVECALSTFKAFHDAKENTARILELLNSLPTKRRV